MIQDNAPLEEAKEGTITTKTNKVKEEISQRGYRIWWNKIWYLVCFSAKKGEEMGGTVAYFWRETTHIYLALQQKLWQRSVRIGQTEFIFANLEKNSTQVLVPISSRNKHVWENSSRKKIEHRCTASKMQWCFRVPHNVACNMFSTVTLQQMFLL